MPDASEDFEDNQSPPKPGTTAEILKTVEGLVKAVPVYQDAVQPLARETGKALGTIGQAINVALSPVRAVIWGYDQIIEFVKPAVERIFEKRKVPKERIIQPDPDVGVPAIEALRYSKLRDLYANLLATAMDSATAENAHPAFVEILKQLTRDEVEILRSLPKMPRLHPLADVKFENKESGQWIIHSNISTLGKVVEISDPLIISRYIDNLCRLGLTHIPPTWWLKEDILYKEISDLPLVKALMSTVAERGKFTIGKKALGRSNLGESFLQACGE